MDVEQVQKINDLALNLMKQGLAENRDDAITQAEKIFKGETTEEYTEMRETMQEVQQAQQIQEPVQSQVDMSQEKIKEILQQNTDFIVKKFKEFDNKVKSMENEISVLRTKLTYNRLPTADQVKPKEEITVKEAPEAPAPIADATPKQSHHRTGNYTDDDVSIEKFFYMGNK